MRHRAYLFVGVVCLMATASEPPIKFLHPKSRLILLGAKSVEIPVQLWIKRHPENRSYRITWDGEHCGGSSARTLDGDQDSQIHPPQWDQVKVRVTGIGTCTVWASVYGSGGKIRASASLDIDAK